MVSPILDDVMVRSMIDTFSNNLLIGTPSSLITTRSNLVSSSSRGLAPIELSHVGFHFELCALKSPISTVLSVMIPFQLTSSIARLFLAYAPRYVCPRLARILTIIRKNLINRIVIKKRSDLIDYPYLIILDIRDLD